MTYKVNATKPKPVEGLTRVELVTYEQDINEALDWILDNAGVGADILGNPVLELVRRRKTTDPLLG